MMREYVIETLCGAIKGIDHQNGVQEFRGIRYAVAGRWEYPSEVTKWEGIYDAGAFGAASYQRRAFTPEQPESFYYNEFRKDEVYTYSEDCLFLNIWKPEQCENAPVIFYIHGGAFQGGCGNEKHFDGTVYAKKGAIFITLNYRLGPLGYCSLPELQERDGHTGNYGLYDQAAALTWVYHNIPQFGGNPSNITVMGQSAGAMSVQQLCFSPEHKKYIAKAIMTSGGGTSPIFGNTLQCSDAYPFWKEIMSHLGNNLEDWVACDVKKLFDETFQTMQRYENGIAYCSPVVDGKIIPYGTDEMNACGMQAEIPYLMGSTKDDLLPEELHRMAKEWAALQTKQNKIPSYTFCFSRNLPGDDKGAWHSSELWYTIGSIKHCWRPMEAWDETIADTMTDYMLNFSSSGNPNREGLPEWDITRTIEDDVMVISDSEIKMGKVNNNGK